VAKKHKHPEHENHERWVVSYADFMTLLFAVFTALFAMARAELASLKDVGAAISQGFNEQSLISGVKSVLKGQSGSDGMGKNDMTGDGVVGKYRNMTYSPGEVEVLDQVTEVIHQVNQAIQTLFENEETDQAAKPAAATGPEEEPGQGQGKDKANNPVPATEPPPQAIAVMVQERGVKISFDSRLLFQPGTAVLKPESMAMVGRIASRLAPLANTHLIHIEGHTDNQPIASALFPSNWELSTARASAVVRLLVSKYHFPQKNMAAVGYGDSRPLANNATPEGRARNRRVDVVIMNPIQSRTNDPRRQAQFEQPVLEANGERLPDKKPSKPTVEVKIKDPKVSPPAPTSHSKLPNPDQQLVHGEDQTSDGRVRVIYQKLDKPLVPPPPSTKPVGKITDPPPHGH
jgi:chemotaxis protein MotB